MFIKLFRKTTNANFANYVDITLTGANRPAPLEVSVERVECTFSAHDRRARKERSVLCTHV